MRKCRADLPFVFPGRLKGRPLADPKVVFKEVITQAKINDFRPHDIRHTFASHTVQFGATLFEV